MGTSSPNNNKKGNEENNSNHPKIDRKPPPSSNLDLHVRVLEKAKHSPKKWWEMVVYLGKKVNSHQQ